MAHIVDLANLGMVSTDSSTANAGLSPDCSPLWNSTIPGLKEGDTLLLPPRYCAFKTPIVALPSGVKLQGQGSMSHMVRMFPQGGSDIFLTVGVSDSHVERVRIWAGDGTTGGFAIGRHGTSPETVPQNTLLDTVEVTRFTTGRFDRGIHLDGTMGTPMYGSRRFKGHNLFVSGVRDVGMWLAGFNASTMSNVTFGAGAPTWSLWIYGNAQNPSNQISVTGTVDGNLLMYGSLCVQVNATALQSCILDANCKGVDVQAAFLATPPNIYGQNCHVRANGQSWKGPS